MSDLWLLALTIVFFCVAAGFVIACDKIIGPDSDVLEELDAESDK